MDRVESRERHTGEVGVVMVEQQQESTDDAGAGARKRTSQASAYGIEAIEELRQLVQWVAWFYAERGGIKPGKVPYSPRTNKVENANDPQSWATYAEAVWANKVGVGFVFTEDDPYLGIDLDGCRDTDTGELTTWANDIIQRINSYTEVSPSGTGVKLWVRARLTGKDHKKVLSASEQIEVYDRARYFTVTGQHLPDTPVTIEERQAEVDAWYAETWPQSAAKSESTRRGDGQVLPFAPLSDDALIHKALQARNGAEFARLWGGDSSAFQNDPSAADAALCAHLAFWTRGDPEQIDRLFRRSGLCRPEKWDDPRGSSTYGQQTIEKALAYVTNSYQPGKQPREAVCVPYIYSWQQRRETDEERKAYLGGLANKAKERVRAHIEAKGEAAPLVIALPPGAGKTRKVAELGAEKDIAWIAERHEMAESVMASYAYRHIWPCSPKTCPEYDLHRAIVDMGLKAWPLHRGHNCAYYRQHQDEGSAFYQIGHVPTAYPRKHDAAIVDELDLSKWLVDHKVKRRRVRQACEALEPLLSYAEEDDDPHVRLVPYRAAKRLLRALYDTFADGALYGKALFDALDQRLGGRLERCVARVAANEMLMQERPTLRSYEGADVLAALKDHGPVVLPLIVRSLQAEMSKWRSGREWNSRLRTSQNRLHILEPLRFSLAEGETLPLVVLDATAHEDLLSRLFGMPVQVERTEDVLPPPSMRHIAVRTGKRYGKTSLVGDRDQDGNVRGRKDGRQSSDAEYRTRVVKELRFVLDRVDPQGEERAAGRVGLITFQDCEEELARRLDIRVHGHFFAVRGSNAFEDCSILLVVGTPTPNLEAVEWAARALYAEDETPIDTTTLRAEDGSPIYQDARLQGLVNYLINAELTQVAHRNRPLRHDGRVVVTLCKGEIDFLPVTEEYTFIPAIRDEGAQARRKEKQAAKQRDDEAKLARAAHELVRRGEKVTGAALARAAEVRKAVAYEWYNRVWLARQQVAG